MTAPTKNVVDLATASTLAGTDKVVMVDVSDTTEGPLGTVKIATITSLSAFFDVISAQGLTTVTNNSAVFVNSAGGVTSGGGAVNYDSGGTFLSSIQLGGAGAANAFDDYEEGNWTPTLPNGGTLSISSGSNLYTKMGRQVTATVYLDSVAPTNNASDFIIGGLPFALTATSFGAASIGFVGDSVLTTWRLLAIQNTATLQFRVTSGNSAPPTNAEYLTAASGSEDRLIFTVTYFTA